MNYKLIQVQNLIDIDNFFERWVSFAKVFEREDFPSFKQMFKEKELKTAFTTTAYRKRLPKAMQVKGNFSNDGLSSKMSTKCETLQNVPLVIWCFWSYSERN